VISSVFVSQTGSSESLGTWSFQSEWAQCFGLFVCNRGDYIIWTQTIYCTFLHSSMSTTNNTIQYHGGLPDQKVRPSPYIALLSLTLRQALSSQPQQQMVWLCYNTSYEMKFSFPLLLANGTLCCGAQLLVLGSGFMARPHGGLRCSPLHKLQACHILNWCY